MRYVVLFVAMALMCSSGFSSEGNRESLTKLEPVSVKVGWDSLRVNKNPENKDVMLRGHECNEYLFAHNDSRLVYDVPEGKKYFAAVIHSLMYFDCRFAVETPDDEVLVKSEMLDQYRYKMAVIIVKIPKDTDQLVLKTIKGSPGGEWTIWAFPAFYEELNKKTIETYKMFGEILANNENED